MSRRKPVKPDLPGVYSRQELEKDSAEELKEMVLVALSHATILSAEHKRADEKPTMRIGYIEKRETFAGEETLIITYVPDNKLPAYKIASEIEKADRRAVKALLKEESHEHCTGKVFQVRKKRGH